MCDFLEVATKFVDFALLRLEGKTIDFTEETQMLFATLKAAGFNPKEVVLGDLRGNYLEQDGSKTGETFPVNTVCPFKVVNFDGDDYRATGWLNSMFLRVLRGTQEKIDHELLVEAIVKEIELSVPLEPIQLTKEGDRLSEYPQGNDHSRDHNNLGCCVGIHEFCGDWMDRRGATATHDAIVCRACHLRVLFPKEIKTYGELREFLAKQLNIVW